MRRSREIASACLLAALALAACGLATPPAAQPPASANPAPAPQPAASHPQAGPRPVRTAMPVNRKPPAPRRATLVGAEQWRAEAAGWLRRDPCAAPCWEGITPGVTTVAEALEQLRQSPLIDPDSVQVYQVNSSIAERDSFVIEWEWVGQYGSGALPDGEAQIWQEPLPTPTPDPNPPAQPRIVDALVETHPITPDRFLRDSPIASIAPRFSAYDSLPQNPLDIPSVFTLGEVIAAYGDPDYAAVLFSGRNIWRVSFVYERAGFVLSSAEGRPLELGPGLELHFVTFALDPIKTALGAAHPSALVPWQGMRDFAFYCRLERTGAPCP